MAGGGGVKGHHTVTDRRGSGWRGGGGVKALYNDRNGETGLDCGADETVIKV